jgi:hypothetical protein
MHSDVAQDMPKGTIINTYIGHPWILYTDDHVQDICPASTICGHEIAMYIPSDSLEVDQYINIIIRDPKHFKTLVSPFI